MAIYDDQDSLDVLGGIKICWKSSEVSFEDVVRSWRMRECCKRLPGTTPAALRYFSDSPVAEANWKSPIIGMN
jgi:hypothetical protein